MIIGIKMTPGAKGQPPEPSVFYCGSNGAEFRRRHAELVEKNTDGSKFYAITHPLLAPLQNVAHSTEDHPMVIAANERRAKLARESKNQPKEAGKIIELPPDGDADPKPETGSAETDLTRLNKAELLSRIEQFNSAVPQDQQIVLKGNETKPQILAALTAALAKPA